MDMKLQQKRWASLIECLMQGDSIMIICHPHIEKLVMRTVIAVLVPRFPGQISLKTSALLVEDDQSIIIVNETNLEQLH